MILGIREEEYGNVQDTRESHRRPRDVREYWDDGQRVIDITSFQYQAKGMLSTFLNCLMIDVLQSSQPA